jgi:TRAP-type C4-dicarboxylate transport system permease large subunit
MVAMTVVAIVLGFGGGGLTRREGWAIIALYALFVAIVCSV